jgi:hypothetical protein
MTDPATWAERGDDWKDLGERLASVPDMFALLTTLTRRIQDAVDARQLGWRLYINLEQGYFSFQRWKGRDHDNALGAEFRILQRSVELALSRRTSRRVQAADHFRQNARVRKGHWLIEVPGVHDVPDIERAVELVADDLGPSDSEPADFARRARSTALDGDASGARGIENQAAGALELLDTPAVGAHGPAGFRTAAAERHAIEDRAMEVVKKQFTDDGWDVEDVHHRSPYDLDCHRAGEVRQVEVKGTCGSGETVILTAGEVRIADNCPGRACLALVTGIKLDIDGQSEPRATGGHLRLIDNWCIDPTALRILAYQYSIPPDARACARTILPGRPPLPGRHRWRPLTPIQRGGAQVSTGRCGSCILSADGQDASCVLPRSEGGGAGERFHRCP